MADFSLPLLSVILGLVLLVAGGELLVRGASSLAVAARISPLVVGLTVVAYGTSSPELAVSVQASLSGQADIAVGNVVGSNICNVLLILGLSALICPLVVDSQLIRFDVPVMIVVSTLVLPLGFDGVISRGDGLILFVGAVLYTVWAICQSRRETRAVQAEFTQSIAAGGLASRRNLLLYIGLVSVGLVLLGIGARYLVQGSVSIARLMGVSELIIGLTIVAIGTSLPEMVTSIVAAIRGERDIAVGNIVGSNIFNILTVLGLSGLVSPHGVEIPNTALRFDVPVMIVVALACLPVFITGHRIARWEGGFFLFYYLAYTTFLVLSAMQVHGTRSLVVGVVGFVVPITVVTLCLSLVRHRRNQAEDSR